MTYAENSFIQVDPRLFDDDDAEYTYIPGDEKIGYSGKISSSEFEKRKKKFLISLNILEKKKERTTEKSREKS